MRHRPAFTLIELLVVILIIAIVSAVTLPTVVPAMQHRQVSESARLVQAAIEGARDGAIRANAPRGIRLLPDPTFPGSTTTANTPLAFNRIVPIEPAGEYNEGRVSIRLTSADPPNTNIFGALRVEESQAAPVTGERNARTSWYWNVRVGDKIRIGESGPFYTVCGPVVDENPERFVNVGAPGVVPTNPNETGSEYLYVVNGQDDDRDGFIDEGFDGIDQDVPPNGVDDGAEWEVESWMGQQAMLPTVNQPYTIRRRPYPSPGARVVELPSDVVIDASTWDSTRERSRLPLDSSTMTVDIMVGPNGQIVPTSIYSSPAASDFPFYHLWLSERGDVMDPVTGAAATDRRLPVPEGTPGLPATETRLLKGERRILTIHTRTGMIVTTDPQSFDASNAPGFASVPFNAAQRGERDAQ